MGIADQKLFTDSVTALRGKLFPDWDEAIGALIRLAMFDMIPAVANIDNDSKDSLKLRLKGVNLNRFSFANTVATYREIGNYGLSLDDENYGRAYLGCTPLDPGEVQKTINIYLDMAKAAIAKNDVIYILAEGNTPTVECCGVVGVAWNPFLVDKRREKLGNSLISNLAAAAHYMLARYHVCAALATEAQMKTIIEGYDAAKRLSFKRDGNINTMAKTPGNPPFPVDYAISDWAFKGAADGEANRRKCNSKKTLPTVPTVDRKKYNIAESPF